MSRVFSRIAATLVQNPADAFRHTYQCIGVVGEHAREKIENPHCGDFCGDLSYILAHLATSQINLPQILDWLNLRGLQGFLPSVQQVCFFAGNVLRNQRLAVSSRPTPGKRANRTCPVTRTGRAFNW